MSFLHHEHVGNHCLPVQDNLWVTTGFFEVGMTAPLSVVVFDDTGIVRRRKLKCLDWNWKGTPYRFKFENGNRTLVYRVSQGFEAYDIVTDTVTPWEPPKD